MFGETVDTRISIRIFIENIYETLWEILKCWYFQSPPAQGRWHRRTRSNTLIWTICKQLLWKKRSQMSRMLNKFICTSRKESVNNRMFQEFWANASVWEHVVEHNSPARGHRLPSLSRQKSWRPARQLPSGEQIQYKYNMMVSRHKQGYKRCICKYNRKEWEWEK